MNNKKRITCVLAGVLCLASGAGLRAQEREELTARRAVVLALQNSHQLALARAQHLVAQRAVDASRSLFLPSLYTGSGAAYTNGFPQTPGGAAPSVFNLSYVQTLFNPPARGQLRAAEQRREVQQLSVERVRDEVILRTVAVYVELSKVRHSLALLQEQQTSAQKIINSMRERSSQGLELPLEVTRSELSLARITQRIVQLQGRNEVLEGELCGLTGLPANRRLEVTPVEFSAQAARPAEELLELAVSSSLELKQAEYERRARQHRMEGERGGRWPTMDLVGEYTVLSRLNNYDEFFRRFQRHNVNLGVQVRIPIFSAPTSASVVLAESELAVADLDVKNRRAALEVEVRRQKGRVREVEASREVARLELQLSQEEMRVLQARFDEGRTALRDLERARLAEKEKWLVLVEIDYEGQLAQLELLKTTGRLATVFQ